MLRASTISPGTKKIAVNGDRASEFIRAYQGLPKSMREELGKVLIVTLWDGYSLTIEEIKE